jgi:predicted DNA-binding transcriptional regulator YafY
MYIIVLINDNYCRTRLLSLKDMEPMGKETEIPRGERLVKIFGHLVRNKARRFTVQDIVTFLSQDENVTLRNVQRDLKALTEIRGIPVRCETVSGKKQYSLEPDMRGKLSLPIQKNGLLAFFLLKRVQTFFAPGAKSMEDITEALIDRAAETDYDEIFEDLDQKLEESTFLLGEKSMLSLDGEQFNNILTSLIKRKKLKILYHAGKCEQPYEKIICPAKLLLYCGELYFVCMSEHYDKDFFVKISRIAKAEILNESFEPDPKRIKRIEDRLVKSFGMFDGVEPKVCRVKVRFPSTPYYKLIFSEKKFHHSQKMSENKKDGIILTMNVPIGLDLVNWVLSWPEAVVVEPKELIEEMRVVARALTKKYGK